jgi:hypothetical protein
LYNRQSVEAVNSRGLDITKVDQVNQDDPMETHPLDTPHQTYYIHPQNLNLENHPSAAYGNAAQRG